MAKFGEKLRTLREKHGLSVRQLAGDLNIKSTGYITNLEKGRSLPSIPLLVKIAHFFDVSSDQLIMDDFELD